MEKKSKIITAVCLTLCLVIGGFVGYSLYNNYKTEQAINNYKQEITVLNTEFANAETSDIKLATLDNTISKHQQYIGSGKTYQEVTDEWTNSLANMKKSFQDGYEKTITENTLENVNESSDKEAITKAKDALTALTEKLKNEGIKTCDSNKLEQLNGKASELTSLYSSKLEAINKAEEEASKKENEASESNNKNNNKASNEGSKSSSKSTKSSKKSSGNKSGGTSGKVRIVINEGGFKSYHDDKGNHWDDAGNRWKDGDYSDWD